jgi:hypothetical protein
MRISRPAPHILIARHTAVRPWFVGLLVVVAAVPLLAGATDPRFQLGGVTVAAAGLLLAIALWRGVSAQVVTLDRNEGLVHVRTQHILGTSSVAHRLADVADVVLERRLVPNGREMYRPAFVMRNGTHQGWGPHTFDHARPEQVTVVRTLREFLGTAGSLTAPDGSVAIQGLGDPKGRLAAVHP